ncbi:MAG: PIG-L family deacetylase [Candidatus Omnitrophica bacterium]|nr:PIG-L family deacetylase [Candidatus Omnitrophota bacterium]MDD5429632.1 PIG-L family deacetylase [Candidatus Omnitrophota bacterium]
MKKCLFFLCFTVFCVQGLAAEVTLMEPFNSQDRVLIFSPHPDDEALCAGGAIQKVISSGGKCKVVYFTNGDHNQLAFIFYKKKMVLKRKGFIEIGQIRAKEAEAADSHLGLARSDIVFLGYPDLGSFNILINHWQDNPPFSDFFTGISRVPYEYCLSPGAEYRGENVLRDIKKAILDFRPTKILVSHPCDTNLDHRCLYVFVRLALWDLEEDISVSAVYPYLTHFRAYPKPKGYHPETGLLPPPGLSESTIAWKKMLIDPQEAKEKLNALSFYTSQKAYLWKFMLSFIRSNELFGDYPDVKLKGNYWAGLNDSGTKGPKDTMASLDTGYKGKPDVFFKAVKGKLFINVALNRKMKKDFKITFLLLGYSKENDFSKMPKMSLSIINNKLRIVSGGKRLNCRQCQLVFNSKKSLVIKIPFSFLGNPDKILLSLKSNAAGLYEYANAWRVIEICR